MALVTYHFAPVTRPFRINAIRAGHQTDSDVTAVRGSDGGFYVVFEAASGRQVDGRIFNEDASPRTGEFRVNTSNVGNQLDPSVTSLSDGSLVTVFEDRASEAIRGRLLDSAGVGEADFFIARGLQGVSKPDVAALANGGFIVTWFSHIAETADFYTQRFNAAGEPVGSPVEIFNHRIPLDLSTTGLADGGFVVAWWDVNMTVDEVRFLFQRFSADGTALGPAVLIQGSQVFSGDIEIAGLPDGGFVASYSANNGTGDGTDVYARIYNANGTPRTDPLRVNAANLVDDDARTTGDQDQAGVTILSNGMIVVSWTDHTGSDTNLEARVLDRNGNAVTDVVNIASTATGESESALAGLLDGKFVATWTVPDEGGGNGWGIQGREFELSRTITGDDTNEVLSGDSLRDRIFGLDGNDVLNGRDGNDRLDGGTGMDRMTGGRGNDLYLVDRSTDLVLETFGQGDDIVWSSASFSLASRGAHIERLKLIGTGDTAGTGNALDNRIIGSTGDNLINGGTGRDLITGGIGDDTFWFTNSLIPENVDRITDLTVADDTFALENAVFEGLAAGPLVASAFRIGNAAADANDRIIYNATTGALLFDRDGTGAAEAVQFAIVARGLPLSHHYFLIT